MLRQSIGFNSILLGLFALVTAGVVAITYQSTKDEIAESRERAAQAALFEIVPPERHDNNLLKDTLPIPEEYREFLGLTAASDTQGQIHVARKNGEPVAAIIPSVAPDGYSGPIKMLVGVNKDGTIAGVRVTDHNETPGLGDYIEVRKSNWILSFNGKTLSSRFDEPVTIKRSDSNGNSTGEEYDQLTGATITRTAVTRQVKKTLSFFNIMQPLSATEAPAENPTASENS